MQKKFKITKYNILFTFCMLFVFIPQISFGELKPMDDESMKKTVAQAGVIDFSNIDNSARLFLDIHIETIGKIDNFSAGHPDDYDLQFNNIQLGIDAVDDENDVPLTIDGLVCIADFDESNNLKRVVMGSNMLNGQITAEVNSYSGIYNENLIAGNTSDVPVEQYHLPVGTENTPTTFNFDNTGMFFILTNTPGISGTNRVGFRMVSGYDETTIGASNWWDHP